MTHLISAHNTDKGQIKAINEDTVYANPEEGLFVLCDGMGGHGAGDIASQMATRVIAGEIHNKQPLEAAVHSANQRILEASQSGMGTPHMGSTVVAALLNQEGRGQIAWVGDSRAYRLSPEKITQITEDHSFVNQLQKEGYINAEEASVHPYRNVLLQSLGGGRSEIEVGMIDMALDHTSVLLICSDGLTNELDDHEILNIVKQKNSLQLAAATLVQAANKNGGHDNISAILVACHQTNNQPS